MNRICVIIWLIITISAGFGADFTWKAEKATMLSQIPAIWTREEQTQKYGNVLLMRPTENYASISVTAFANKSTENPGFGSLTEITGWANNLALQNGDKLESQTNMPAGALKIADASEGSELNYSWVNQQGISGRTILRIMQIRGRFYEYRLSCSNVIWQSESKNLIKYLDSIHLGK